MERNLISILFVGCLRSQQHANVSQARMCPDNCTCWHAEIEVGDQTSYLAQSQYIDTGPTSTGADPITPDSWNTSLQVTGMNLEKDLRAKAGIEPRSADLEAGTLTTRPTRWSVSFRSAPKSSSWRSRDWLVVGCLTSQQHASVSQGRICSDNFTCCHTETEAADQTFYLTQSQYTDTGPTSPSADPITPGAWQGSHWSANF